MPFTSCVKHTFMEGVHFMPFCHLCVLNLLHASTPLLWALFASCMSLTSMRKTHFMPASHFYGEGLLHDFTLPFVLKNHFMIYFHFYGTSSLHGHLTPMCTNYTSCALFTLMFHSYFMSLSYFYAILILHVSLSLLCVWPPSRPSGRGLTSGVSTVTPLTTGLLSH